MFEHLFRVYFVPHLECPSSKRSCQFNLRRSVATYPIRKEMGARSQRRCLPGPIPNPEVKPFCVSPITVVRESTGKEVTVPLSFHFGILDPKGRLRPVPPLGPAFFAFYRRINITF